MLPGSSMLFVGSTLSEKAVANTASYVTAKHAMVHAFCRDFGRLIGISRRFPVIFCWYSVNFGEIR